MTTLTSVLRARSLPLTVWVATRLTAVPLAFTEVALLVPQPTPVHETRTVEPSTRLETLRRVSRTRVVVRPDTLTVALRVATDSLPVATGVPAGPRGPG